MFTLDIGLLTYGHCSRCSYRFILSYRYENYVMMSVSYCAVLRKHQLDCEN